jgi:hypothetical protein
MIGDVPYMSAAIEAKKKPTATRGVNAATSCGLLAAPGCEARWVVVRDEVANALTDQVVWVEAGRW